MQPTATKLDQQVPLQDICSWRSLVPHQPQSKVTTGLHTFPAPTKGVVDSAQRLDVIHFALIMAYPCWDSSNTSKQAPTAIPYYYDP